MAGNNNNSNYYGFTYGGTQTGTSFVPAVDTGSGYADPATSAEAAYIAYPSAADNQYNCAQGISYPAYNQTTSVAGQSLGYSGYSATDAAYNNSYNQAVTDYAATAYYGSGSNSNAQHVYLNQKVSSWKRGNTANRDSRDDQLHYCEICKISCAGLLTYETHLKGKQHMRKKAAESNQNSGGVNPVMIRCELCDVSCPGPESYQAHIGGSKHSKVLSLHQKMGKPIPEMPQIPPVNASATVRGTPTLSFKDGGCLSTTKSDGSADAGPQDDDACDEAADLQAIRSLDEVIAQAKLNSGSNAPPPCSTSPVNSGPVPIGEEYVVDVPPKDGKPASFFCNICKCPIGDRVAKGQHLRGKRHRYAYKTKVDPTIDAEVFPKPKPQPAAGSSANGSFGPNTGSPAAATNASSNRPPIQQQNSGYRNRGGGDWNGYNRWNNWPPVRSPGHPNFMPSPRYPHQFGPYGTMPMSRSYGYGPMAPYRPPHPPAPRPVLRPAAPPPPDMGPREPVDAAPALVFSNDDHILMKKHSLICPTQEEVDFIFKFLNTIEKALKLVSDDLVVAKVEAENSAADQEDASDAPARILKGLMRVGPAAKELLLLGDNEAHIVVICSEKPTKVLQEKVIERLGVHLKAIQPESEIRVFLDADDYTITVTVDCGPVPDEGNIVTVRVCLTSPLMRSVNKEHPDQETGQDPESEQNLLNREHCLQSLASVRRTKWYQARVADLDPAPVVIRVLRDLCRRDSSWSSLSAWSLMLLSERVITSAGEPVTPSEALRHVLEAISSGILLSDSTGLLDPCEKEPVDALSYLNPQQRDDITLSAQRALRLCAFHEIHLFLGLEIQSGTKKRKVQENTDPEVKSVTPEENFADDDDFMMASETNGMQQFSSSSS